MRYGVGVYEHSGWPGFVNQDQHGFPDNWDPRFTLAGGTGSGPDHFEAWKLSADKPRIPTVQNDKKIVGTNKADQAGNYGKGLKWNGNIPVDQLVDVHSTADVAIYSNGPGSDLFKKTIENWNLFFKMTEALDLQFPNDGDALSDEKNIINKLQKEVSSV